MICSCRSGGAREPLAGQVIERDVRQWEHEKYFRERIVGHWMLRLLPLWPSPPPKEAIRAEYAESEEVLSRPA